MALGADDLTNLDDEEVEEAKQYLLDNRDNFRAFAESDWMVNLFKPGEVALADGGRGTTQAMVDDGLAVEWVAPKEGALMGLPGVGDGAEGAEHPRGLQADQLLRLAGGAGDLGRHGVCGDEPRRDAVGVQGLP